MIPTSAQSPLSGTLSVINSYQKHRHNMLLPMQPILKPSQPFVDKFLTELHPGSIIVINGSTPPSAKDFEINFALGPNYKKTPQSQISPIAFHFNPRFDHNYTARNTFQNGWGPEESSSPNSIFPFQRGQTFEIMILITLEGYMVAVDEKHYIRYKHRIPYQRVDTLQVLKDVIVDRIMLHEERYPEPKPMPIPPSTRSKIQYNLAVPFETPIPGGTVRQGTTVYMSGRPLPEARRFNIDLFFGGKYGPAGDVAFHISVRFPQRVIVRNTNIKGVWGVEERELFEFMFEPNTNFDLKITCESNHFVVFVNGQHLCNYRHRLSYSQIDRFRVDGDILVQSLMFDSK